MNMTRTLLVVGGLLLLSFSSPVHAASYYSDPVGGDMGNDGSEGSPWGNLEAVFQAKKTFNAGDEIILLNGAHGQPYITGNHADYVTIRPYPGHSPRISSIQFGAAAYWAFDGLIFTSDGSGGSFSRDYMIATLDATTYLKIVNCAFYSAESSATWSKTDWYANAEDALIIRGDYTIFTSNTIENTYFALQIEGDHAEVKHNLIDNFGADAIRALGSHAVYEGNVIRDAYVEDYGVNHDDAIQMYDRDNVASGVVGDLVFRNNKIYSFSDPVTQAMIDDDLVGYSMQGIIVTDGHVENSVFENNLVVGDHYHGITLSGAVNCRVQNNTVMKTPTSVNPETDAFPWIQLDEDKQHNNPSDCILRNNIASKFTPWTHAGGTNIQVENNLEPATNEYSGVFADYAGFDFSLMAGSPAIDAGTNVELTATDLAGNPRLAGPAVDCGAYEYQPGNDTIPPVISDAGDTWLNDEVVFVFSESVTQDSAENVDHYLIDGGISVTNAVLAGDNRTVTLCTSALVGGVGYTVFAGGVEDFAGNISSNASAGFAYLCGTNWASTFQDDDYGYNPPEDAFDGNFDTKWAAEGTEWIQKSFCRNLTLESVDIAFALGDQRTYSITIEVSTDGRTFSEVFSGQSSGNSVELESFDFADVSAKYIKITGSGNSQTGWNSYTEIGFRTSDPARLAYEAWLGNYPGVGGETNRVDDPDLDQLDNLEEWALGGNPSDPTDQGFPPVTGVATDAGTNWFKMVYAKRQDADALGLGYHLEKNTNLVEGGWANARVYSVESTALDGEFDTVMNRMRIGPEKSSFYRLIVSCGEWMDSEESGVSVVPTNSFSVGWEFSALDANAVDAPLPATHADVSVQNLGRSSGLDGVSMLDWPDAWGIFNGANGIYDSSLAGALLSGRYLSVSLTPATGNTISLDSLVFDAVAGGTSSEVGIGVFSSLTGFSAADVLSTTNLVTGWPQVHHDLQVNLSGVSELQEIDQVVEFRFYVWKASGAPSRFGFGKPFASDAAQDLVFSGTISSSGGGGTP